MNQNNIFKNYKILKLLLEDGATFTAFDTETTGLQPQTDRIIEIGAVKFDIDGVIDNFETLINPQCPITPEVTAVNHITNSMVENSPEIKDVLPNFFNFINGTILIAHNANFDLNFINWEAYRNNLPPIRNKTVDTLDLSYWAYPRFEKHNLQFLAKTLSINVQNAHRADDDARVCMDFFLRSLKDTNSMQKKFQDF